MSADDKPGLVSVAVLAHHLDAHPVVGEGRGNRGEDTGAVSDVEIDVIAREGLADREDRQAGVGALPRADGPREYLGA